MVYFSASVGPPEPGGQSFAFLYLSYQLQPSYVYGLDTPARVSSRDIISNDLCQA